MRRTRRFSIQSALKRVRKPYYTHSLIIIGVLVALSGAVIVHAILSLTHTSSQPPTIIMSITNLDQPTTADLLLQIDECRVAQFEVSPTCRVPIYLGNTSLSAPRFYFTFSGKAELIEGEFFDNAKSIVSSQGDHTTFWLDYADKGSRYPGVYIPFRWNPFSTSDYDRYTFDLTLYVDSTGPHNLLIRNYWISFLSPISPTETTDVYPQPYMNFGRTIWRGSGMSLPGVPIQTATLHAVVHLPSLEIWREYYATVGSILTGVGATVALEGLLDIIRGRHTLDNRKVR